MSKFDANFTEEIIEPDTEGSGVNIEDFVAYPPSHVYIFTPCRDIWVGPGVDACLPPVPVLTKAGRPKRDKNGKVVALRATRWLDQNQRVEGMTWCPGQPMLINANNAPEDAELADVLDALGCPDAVTPKQLIAAATGATAEWLTAHRSRRSIPLRLERCGYSQVRNKDAGKGNNWSSARP